MKAGTVSCFLASAFIRTLKYQFYAKSQVINHNQWFGMICLMEFAWSYHFNMRSCQCKGVLIMQIVANDSISKYETYMGLPKVRFKGCVLPPLAGRRVQATMLSKLCSTRRKYEMEKYSSCSRMRWRNPPSCLTWKCKIQRWWKKSEFHTKLEIYHEENDVTHSLIAWSIRRQSIWAPFVPQDVKWERGAQWMAQRPNQWTTMYRHCQQRWTPGCVKPREQITQPRAYFLAISLPLLLREDGVFFAHTSCTFPMEKTDRKDRKEECKNHPQQHMCMYPQQPSVSFTPLTVRILRVGRTPWN